MRKNETKKLRAFSKQLRTKSTEAESALWYHLRHRRFCGIKFLRQKIIAGYIVDFVSLEVRLIIELDGSQHALQQDYDNCRSEKLQALGFQIIRFWNDDVLRNQDMVLETIWLYWDNFNRQRVSPPSVNGARKI